MSTTFNITKRERRRKLKNGSVTVQTRWVLNYREPRSDKRVQRFFSRNKDALATRDQLIAKFANGTYCADLHKITIGNLVDRWLSDCARLKRQTLAGYQQTAKCVVGPVLVGTTRQRHEYSRTGKVPAGTQLISMLGDVNVGDLTTGDIRAWHRTVQDNIGHHTANRAKMFLKAALVLGAEDFGFRPPSMPTIGRSASRPKKAILATDQVKLLLHAAHADRERGPYVAFPFLAGTRPSEQLGLLWEDVDFEANVIRIQRMQERDGTITNFTKTIAGTRDVPMCSLLRKMLIEWRVACPRRNGELFRVFPGLGRRQAWPLPRTGGGGPLLYWNFRKRFWVPALQSLGLPVVTPHSARHCFISTLQAQGIEVGVVAKLAGHASPAVTLGHYTQAIRGGEGAVEALERAFTA